MHPLLLRIPRRLGSVGILLGLAIAHLSAQSASTVPMGAARVNIAGGTIAAPVMTAFALPFESERAGAVKVGRARTVARDTVSITGATWRANELADPASPYAVRILSGAAAGRVGLVAGNGTDAVRLRATDVTDWGLTTGASGDWVAVFPVETLNSLFGARTFVGGPDPTAADIVYLGAQTQDGYYFNTSRNQWRRASGRSAADAGNVPLLPHAVIQVTRTGPGTTITLVGRVPATPFRAFVANSGNTYLHTGFPTDVTLANLGLDRRIPDWVAGATPALADQVTLLRDGGPVTLFHNGINWVDTARRAVQDNLVISAETPLLIARTGSAPGFTPLVRPLPYSL